MDKEGVEMQKQADILERGITEIQKVHAEPNLIIIALVAVCIIIVIGFSIQPYNSITYDAINEPYFTAQDNIPDGVYKQGMWGFLEKENASWTWWFPLCEHGGWGPLHSKWNVTESVIESLALEPINDYNSYSIDRDAYAEGSRLFIQIKNKVIVNAWVGDS